MQTVIDNLRETADRIGTLLENLLLEHSSLEPQWRDDYNGRLMLDSQLRGIPPQRKYTGSVYHDLGETGQQIQAKLLEEYRNFHSLMRVFLAEQPQSTLNELEQVEGVLIRTIEHQFTECHNTQEALTVAKTALNQEISLLTRLYGAAGGEHMLVPDTNALLKNPSLETWKFDNVSSFTLILVPTVLEELDSLKINHRNETVREKAENLIRQIKEYRRRGKISEGVPLVKGKSRIATIATEPRFDRAPKWFDPTNNDDRFLMSVIEVMRTRPRSPVGLVTHDINMQNKAEFAGISFLEPP